MVTIPSFSGEEREVADYISSWLELHGVEFQRIDNNILLHKSANMPHNSQDNTLSQYSSKAPSLLLCAHIDTVKPSNQYSSNPFDSYNPTLEEKLGEEIIFGLGSNDDGGCVTAMLYTYLHFLDKELPFDLGLILTAEEERSGPKGMASLSSMVTEKYDFCIIGEPTSMKGGIAERGLLVLDGVATGVPGHAARDEGKNAIYIAMKDIATLRDFKFEKVSPSMGKVKLSVTQIQAGTLHNVIPDKCTFVLDIRTTEQYSSPEIYQMLQEKCESTLTPRKLTNKSSATPIGDPFGDILREGLKMCEIEEFVSPTTSDWMEIYIPTIKMGPGESSRSHRADEYIKVSEIESGIKGYIKYIEALKEIIENSNNLE